MFATLRLVSIMIMAGVVGDLVHGHFYGWAAYGALMTIYMIVEHRSHDL